MEASPGENERYPREERGGVVIGSLAFDAFHGRA